MRSLDKMDAVMALARLDAVEAKLDAAERRRRFDDERSPAGTVLWGGAYGWEGRAIFKRYSGVMRTMGDDYGCIVAVHVASLIDDSHWGIQQIANAVASGPRTSNDIAPHPNTDVTSA